MHNEHGTVIVFVTFMIVLLMIMVGFGLDTSMMTYTRKRGIRDGCRGSIGGERLTGRYQNEQRRAGYGSSHCL